MFITGYRQTGNEEGSSGETCLKVGDEKIQWGGIFSRKWTFLCPLCCQTSSI